MKPTTDASLTLLTTMVTIVGPALVFIWKVAEFFITRMVKKLELAAKVDIEKAQIAASLRSQEEIVKLVRQCNGRVYNLNIKFNRLIDFLVPDATLRDELRHDENNESGK